MVVDGYQFMLDSITKFHNTLYISGWFHHPSDRLKSVNVIDRQMKSLITKVELDYPAVSSLGKNKGFFCQLLRNTSEFDQSSKIEFKTHSGWQGRFNLLELASERLKVNYTLNLFKKFQESLLEIPSAKILDIGGRARSKVDRSKDFPNFDYTVLDIHDGENVDVVGDAHKLSDYFANETFDAIFSVAVFEHLVMPWKVVLEMNKCMKKNAFALIVTHQTIGMHDIPWDFFRFSDSAWDGLFNQETGFEIISREMTNENYILPFIYRLDKEHAERAAGFETSAVLVRKTSNTNLSWDVSVEKIISSHYPLD